ncbi:MAG TPA: HAMP domain-containing sensor histidine kinase, partial [Puia sp.]|nr:HAMP domain-containing sensor histidine kinase [Puia sp.]
LTKQVFDMDAFLDETIASFQMISKSHFIIKGSGPVHAKVMADKQRIEQVLFNLLSNAVKYSPGEKKVIVSSTKTDGELVIKIRDFGIGVLKEEQLNIFERFYRSKDTSIHISGFGLGLYICMDIIKRHGGKMWVESEKKGSSFYFSLPLIDQNEKNSRS